MVDRGRTGGLVATPRGRPAFTNRAWKAVCAGLLIAFSSCGPSGTDPAGENGEECRSTLEDRMSAVLSQIETDRDFTLYIEAEDGGSYTYSRGRSTLRTSYKSASTSKWVTATIILRLVDRGVLSLADRPKDLIPDWPIPDSDSLSEITLADLLSFTSGLTDEPLCVNLPGDNYAACVRRIAEINRGNGKIPGTEFHYGSAHLQVAGLMAIEATRAASWGDLFEAFQQETGLFSNGAYDLPSSDNPRLAGGMHWQAKEYADFIRAFYFGDLLKGETKEKMLADQITGATIGDSPALDGVGEDWHYGFGIWLQCPGAVFDCDSTTYYSSPGAYGAYPFMNTRQRFFGIVARQGALGTFPKGKAVYDAVADLAERWAGAAACDRVRRGE